MDTQNEVPPQYTNREYRDGDGWIAELNPSAGDFRTVWNKDSPEEVEQARKAFNDLTAKGHTAYSCDKNGDKGKLMREFDPNAEAIILVPRMKGG